MQVGFVQALPLMPPFTITASFSSRFLRVSLASASFLACFFMNVGSSLQRRALIDCLGEGNEAGREIPSPRIQGRGVEYVPGGVSANGARLGEQVRRISDRGQRLAYRSGRALDGRPTRAQTQKRKSRTVTPACAARSRRNPVRGTPVQSRTGVGLSRRGNQKARSVRPAGVAIACQRPFQ